MKNTADCKKPDPGLEKRANDLLALMTPDEMFAQLGGWIMPYGNPPGTEAGGIFSLDESVRGALALGIGTVSYVNMGLSPRAGAQWSNAIQRYLVENTRLGIPALFCEECAFGHIVSGATCFPAPANLAASFDTDLAERVYRAVSR